MHFDTASAAPGKRARLESRLLYPATGGGQCLQFFLHNSSGADDYLLVMVREYDKLHPEGRLRVLANITGFHLLVYLKGQFTTRAYFNDVWDTINTIMFLC